MKCTQAEILIQQGLDGRLSSTERSVLDAHLARCVTCTAAWDEYRCLARTAVDWTQQTLISEEMGHAFTDGVMARIATGSSVRAPRRFRLPVGFALLAVLTLIAIFVWIKPQMPSLAFSPFMASVFSLHQPDILPADFLSRLVQMLAGIPHDASALCNAFTIKPFAAPTWIWSALAATLGINIFFGLRARQQNRKMLLR